MGSIKSFLDWVKGGDAEDDYEEDPDFRDNASEDPEDLDAEEYLPEAADDADAQLDEMKKELAASVAEKPEHGAEKRGEEPLTIHPGLAIVCETGNFCFSEEEGGSSP